MEHLINILAAVFFGLLSNQIYDCGPRLAYKLIRLSANRLGKDCATRYEEEWKAHLQECDGKLGMMTFGLQCLFASFRINPPFWGYWIKIQTFFLFFVLRCLFGFLRGIISMALLDARLRRKPSPFLGHEREILLLVESINRNLGLDKAK